MKEKTRTRPGWDDYFIGFAEQASSRSDCIRAQVGAVIVNTRRKVRGTGYNNSPSGVESCLSRGICYRIEHSIESGTRYETCRSIHAEQNAIIQAGEDNCVGSTIYIFGHTQVCILCKRFILNAGLVRVVLRKDHDSPLLEIDPGIWRAEL
ncbi:MAG: cytidine deaminase [Spirochaetaceae bacterium]|nr:MAG: cytidine deaminase [Spirochaetaceae bacterium]